MDYSEIQILLVEDSLQDVTIIQRSLKKQKLQNLMHLARDGREALDFLSANPGKIGVLLLDIHLPKMGGMDVLRHAKDLDPEIVVIMLTGKASVETAVESLRHEGAFDYLEKSKDDLPQLIKAVSLALKKRALSLKTHWTFESERGTCLIDMTEIERRYHLSKREMDVVKCLCLGDTNREIAEKLFISELTVKVHLKKIYEKMDVHNRTSLSSIILACAIAR